MSYELVQNLSKYNYGTSALGIKRIEYITWHYFGGLTTAQNISNWFAVPEAKSSAHYNVDEQPKVWVSVLDQNIAWHCGSSAGYVHPKCRNANSIGIEIRPRKLSSATLSALDRDWYFDDETMQNALALTRDLMEKYNIPVENVLRHYDVTGKMCPRPLMGADINTYYKKSGDEMWNWVKTQLSRKEGLTVEQYNELNGKITEISDALNRILKDIGSINAALEQDRKQLDAMAKNLMPIYKTVADVPDWGRADVQAALERDIIKGIEVDIDGNITNLGLSYDNVRNLVFAGRREVG